MYDQYYFKITAETYYLQTQIIDCLSFFLLFAVEFEYSYYCIFTIKICKRLIIFFIPKIVILNISCLNK